MVVATEGVLVTCDAAMKAYIMHLDEEQQQDPNKGSFVINANLDDTHVLVKEDAVPFVQEKIDELQRANTFSRPSELSATGAADKNTQSTRGRKKDAGDASKKRKKDG